MPSQGNIGILAIEVTSQCEITFISSISLFLELAGSILAQTLLNPPKVV